MGATTRRRNSYALLSTMCDRVLPLKTCFLPSSCVGIWQKKSDRKPGNWCCEFNFEDIDVVIKVFNNKRETAKVVREVGRELISAPIDVAFVGIGENGHLAFNDPPADFETEEPYIVVTLDEACRRQQLGEGWFPTFEDVPKRAISMSIRQILKAKQIVCFVPDARKANAVKVCFEGEISPLAPASILRTHPDTTVYLDVNSATLLRPATLASAS